MQLGRFKDRSLIIKLLIWMGWMAVSGILFTIITGGLQSQGVNIQTASIMRWILVYQDVFIFIVPALIAVCMWSEQPLTWLHVNQPIKGYVPLLAALIMIIALPGSNLLAFINQQITLPECFAAVELWIKQTEQASEQAINIFLNDTHFSAFIFNFIVIAILAAIGEEICFRGVLQGLMKHTKTAIWITAIIFSSIHMQFYGFIPRLLMGALFGYMLVWSKNIWIPIIMHCTNNGMIAILYYIAKVNNIDTKKMDTFGTEDTLWIGILSLMLVGIGIYILRRSLTISNASSRTSKGN